MGERRVCGASGGPSGKGFGFESELALCVIIGCRHMPSSAPGRGSFKPLLLKRSVSVTSVRG
jgi:hypothetical protein